jgi:tagatose 1,6-diphosphate aldolase
LIDRELELVSPHARWIDEVLAARGHPLTQLQAPEESRVTREHLIQFLKEAPGGHEQADPLHERSPQYHFWMRLRREYVGVPGSPPVRILGGIGLRIGSTVAIERYYGNVGYHVLPPARGRHYAERACRLLLPLARRHGLSRIWITCNPDNEASKITCQRLGAAFIETVPVPHADPLYLRGEHYKCRFRLDVGGA